MSDLPKEASGSRLWLTVLGLSAIAAVNVWGLGAVVRPGELGDVQNQDAMELLRTIREEQSPLKWFWSDWPLGNGFYRPLPTLLFELESRVYGDEIRGYRITNWLIALASAFLLVWFVWELLRSAYAAIGCGLILSGWQSGLAGALPLESAGLLLGALLFIVGFLPGRGGLWRWAAAGALAYMVCRELSGKLEAADIENQSLALRTIAWPPGRTATLMTLFGLVSLAAYCRFERERRAVWGAVAIIALLLAFGCYEQAVVIAPALLACGVALRAQGVEVRWKWHLLPWAATAAYVGLHESLLPADTRYQLQAARPLKGAMRDLGTWLFPAAFELRVLSAKLDPAIGLWALTMHDTWLAVAKIIANAAAYARLRAVWLPAAFGLLVSAGAYGPMAFLHPFSHYLYFPLAMRSVFVVWLIWACFDAVRRGLSKEAGAQLPPLRP